MIWRSASIAIMIVFALAAAAAETIEYDPQGVARSTETQSYVNASYTCMRQSVPVALNAGERDTEAVKAWLTKRCAIPMIRHLRERGQSPEQIGDYVDRMSADAIRATPGVKIDLK